VTTGTTGTTGTPSATTRSHDAWPRRHQSRHSLREDHGCRPRRFGVGLHPRQDVAVPGLVRAVPDVAATEGQQRLCPALLPGDTFPLTRLRHEVVGEVSERLEVPADLALLVRDIDQRVGDEILDDVPILGAALARKGPVDVEYAVPLEPLDEGIVGVEVQAREGFDQQSPATRSKGS
jgi:hypothetical protein